MSASNLFSQISQFISSAFSSVMNLLDTAPKDSFDEFIKSRNPKTPEELEFATQQYNERRRLEIRLMQQGEYAAAQWLRKTY